MFKRIWKLRRVIFLLAVASFITNNYGSVNDTISLSKENRTNNLKILQTSRLSGVEELFESADEVIAETENKYSTSSIDGFDFNNIPEYTGASSVIVNNNKPFFAADLEFLDSFEAYGELDELGRCTSSVACLSKDTMPAKGEQRGEIGMVKPTGWHTIKYDCIEDRYLYNRCHVIGWQLGAENANEQNLVTGTRYMNLEMCETENEVAQYIRKTGNHVLYRVTPVFLEDELVCRGLLMEGRSVEDNTIKYCIFYYNVQPGIEIDYKTGESREK